MPRPTPPAPRGDRDTWLARIENGTDYDVEVDYTDPLRPVITSTPVDVTAGTEGYPLEANAAGTEPHG